MSFNTPPPVTYDDLPDPDEFDALSPVRRRVMTVTPLPFGMLSSTKKKNTSAVATAAASKPLLSSQKNHRWSPSSLFSPSKFLSNLNKSVEHELDGMGSEDEDEYEYDSDRNTFSFHDDVKVAAGKENMMMSVQPKMHSWNGVDGKTMMTPTNCFKKTTKTATSPANVTPLVHNNNNDTTPKSKNSGYDGDYDDEDYGRKKNGPTPSSMGLKSFDSLAVQQGGSSSFGASPVPMKKCPPLKEVTIVNDGTDLQLQLDLPTPKTTNGSFSFPDEGADDVDPKISNNRNIVRSSGDECCNMMGGLIRSFGSLFSGGSGHGRRRRHGYHHMQNDDIWFPEDGGGEPYSKLYDDEGEDDSDNCGPN